MASTVVLSCPGKALFFTASKQGLGHLVRVFRPVSRDNLADLITRQGRQAHRLP